MGLNSLREGPLLGVGVQRNTAGCGGKCRGPTGSGRRLIRSEQLGEAEAPAEVVPTAFFASPVRVSRGFLALYDHVLLIGKKA